MKKIFLITSLVIMSFYFSKPSFAANLDSQIKTQQKNKKDIEQKLKKYNTIIKEKNQQSKNLLGKLNKLKKDANASNQKISTLESENTKLHASIENLNQNINSINKDIKIILKMLEGRLLEIYKYSLPENSLNLLLTSENPHEALNTAYLLNRFAVQDQIMLSELLQKQSQLRKVRRELESDEKKIKVQSDELKRKRAEFDSTIKQTDALLKDVQAEQKKAENAAAELTAAQREIGSKINNLMRQKKQASKTSTTIKMKGKNVTKTTSTAKQPTRASTSTSSAPRTTTTVKSLAWPVNGRVTAQYGSRIHPTFKTKIFNSGIDIASSSGTPVKAAAPGEVLYQGWLKGFGQVVIVDHGGDLTTVYAHLSSTSVREGNIVNTGTVIGRVGNTGTDSEYGLHFEVRKNGNAQNPMNFLRR